MGLLVPLGMERVGRLLRPRGTPSVDHGAAYESGIVSTGDTWQPQYLRYYLYALVFVLFDAETAFLYPWADAYNRIPPIWGLEAVAFIVLLLLGLAYAWRKGVMEWM